VGGGSPFIKAKGWGRKWRGWGGGGVDRGKGKKIMTGKRSIEPGSASEMTKSEGRQKLRELYMVEGGLRIMD